jgi:hypothetical protein
MIYHVPYDEIHNIQDPSQEMQSNMLMVNSMVIVEKFEHFHIPIYIR